MNKHLGPFLLVAALAVGCVTSLPTAEAQSLVALNSVAMAGKQRMLSLRALKAYAQLSLNVAPEKATAILAASLDELKSSNAALRPLAKDANLAALQSQATLIDKLAAVTRMPPSAGSVQQAAQVSEELLINAEAVTLGFVKSGAEAPAALVNLAARQRMLSQRAAGSYFAYQATARSPELKARPLKATADFQAAISAVEDAKAEFPQIADRLEMARMQMIFFDNVLCSIDSPTKEQFATIASTSERILGEMDSMTSEIVKQLAARNAAATTTVSKK